MSLFQVILWRSSRWERVHAFANEYRYYELTLQQDIFGEWEVVRTWGRIGQRGGSSARRVWLSYDEAHADFADEVRRRERRRYTLRNVERRGNVFVGPGSVAYTVHAMRQPDTGEFSPASSPVISLLELPETQASTMPFCLR